MTLSRNRDATLGSDRAAAAAAEAPGASLVLPVPALLPALGGSAVRLGSRQASLPVIKPQASRASRAVAAARAGGAGAGVGKVIGGVAPGDSSSIVGPSERDAAVAEAPFLRPSRAAGAPRC